MIEVLMFDESSMRGLLAACYRYAEAESVDKYASEMYQTAHRYGISTPLRLAHWLAQVGHESGELRYTEELASGRAYEGRKDLGNTEPGDGIRFKGRGLIQLTGRRNYSKYMGAIGKELEPQELSELPWCVDSAGWFWTKGSGMNLNSLADRDNLVAITRRINGGLNGFRHRERLLKQSKREIDYLNSLTLQRLLNGARRWPHLVEDGIFGPRTSSVLMEMQSDYFLPPTGDVDLKTYQKLLSLSA